MRPRQWSKNSLVLVAALTSGIVFEFKVWPKLVLAFLIFTLISSSIYLINDICDRKSDEMHPKKKHRVIASGKLNTKTALVAAFLLATVGVCGVATQSTKSFLIVVSYLGITVLYSIKLKYVPIIEILVVSLGFVLRVWFGASVISVPMSTWLGTSIFFGASMIIIAKRLAESRLHDKRFVRHVILKYNRKVLSSVEIFAAISVILTYSLWTAFGQQDFITQRILLNISCLPFVATVARFVYIAQKDGIEEPEEFLLSDHITQVMGAIFITLLTAGIFVNS